MTLHYEIVNCGRTSFFMMLFNCDNLSFEKQCYDNEKVVFDKVFSENCNQACIFQVREIIFQVELSDFGCVSSKSFQ